MNALKKKLNKNEGFTLVEMLIVVAIIAILVAVSIPLINSALERARNATDQANERAAKAEAVIWYMGLAGDKDGNPLPFEANKEYMYSAKDGCLVPSDGYTVEKYGKCTDPDGCVTKYTIKWLATGGTHKEKDLGVTVSDGGKVTLAWK